MTPESLYRRSLFESLRFPEGIIYEDEFLTPKIVYKANKVICVPDILYYYRLSPNSIMRSTFSRKNLDLQYVHSERIDWIKKNGLDEFMGICARNYLFTLYDLIPKINGTDWTDKKEIVDKFKAEIIKWRKATLKEASLMDCLRIIKNTIKVMLC